MSANKLKLNSEKTEVLVLHPKATAMPVIDLHFGKVVVKSSQSARNLGVKFDATLSYKDHISSICSSGYRHLRKY